MRYATALLLMLVVVPAQAEQSTDSTGDYFTDFGQVYGAMVAVQHYRDICAETYAQFTRRNSDAYAAWRVKYLKFLQEMEKHRTSAAWREAKGDEKKYVETLAKFGASLDRYKDALREQFSSNGPEGFRRICMGYPEYLQSDRGNLEYFYAEQVATVRKGPPTAK